MNYHTETRKKRNYYTGMRKQRKKKKRLPPALLLIPLCAAAAVCIALAVYLRRGQDGGAEKYYRDNSKLIDMISLEDSTTMLTEMQAMFNLAVRGFAPQFDDDGSRIGYPVSYHYAPDGGYVEETEVSIISTDKHPMYQTFYVSEDTEGNRIGWVIDIINGEVFARPVSFVFETTCDKEILLTEDKEGKFTSYCDGTFYITIPHKTAVTAVSVDKIDAETLDGITFDDLCALTGAARLASAEVSGGENELAAVSSVSDRKISALSASAAKADSDDTVIVVSLGDSFSSGEGIEEFIDQDRDWSVKVKSPDFLAHRSTNSWPSRLKIPDIDGTMADYWVRPDSLSIRSVQWYFYAVSGAETQHIYLEEQPKYYNKRFGKDMTLSGSKTLPKQLDIFNKINGEDVDFVTITIGGNDVGFGDIITTCILGSPFLETAVFGRSSLKEMLDERLEDIEGYMKNIRNVYRAVAAKAPYAAIIVAGYPELLDSKGKLISVNEANWVNSAVSTFNSAISNLVTECWESGLNIYFVDVETEFHGHQAYATAANGDDIAWLNPVWFGSKFEDLEDGEKASKYSMHPNDKGAQAYADLVNAELADYAEFGDFGNNLHWEYDIRTETLTISGTGEMPDYRFGLPQQLPWYRFMHRIEKVIIEDGVTSIGSNAFAEFDWLTSVEIGSTVSKIGEFAFLHCYELSAVSALPVSLSSVGPGAFYGTGLTDFYFAGDPPAVREVSAGKDSTSFAYGTKGDTGKITLHYPAALQNKWDSDGDGKWKGYRIEPYDMRVSGTVYDRGTYERVQNAAVQITKQGDEKVYETVTDANGNFTINIPGTVPVKLTIEISAEGYESQTLHQTSAIMVIQLVIPLVPESLYPVTITVVDENSKGLPGITIEGTELDPAPVTGSDGSASFKLPAGTYNLTVSNGTRTAQKTLTVTDDPVSLEITLASNDNLIVKQVSLGGWHSAAITEDGTLYKWGYNNYGQLGNGTIKDSYTPIKIMDNVTYVSLGNSHSAAITKDGSLYMWGCNIGGQLGDGTTEDRSTPIKIMDNVAYVSLGTYHSAAITTDGSLYTWGGNSDGRLGNGTTESSHTPVKIMDNVAYVSLGNNHSAAITTDGSLYTWGNNHAGQLGNGTTEDSSIPIKIMDNVVYVSLGHYYSAAITTGGSLYTWGNKYYDLLADEQYDCPSPIKIMDNVAYVSLGQYYSATITTNGSLYMWGENFWGQLGNGTTDGSSTPIKIMDNVARVSIGSGNSAAMTADGSLYAWGYNNHGQLGNGTTKDSSTPIKITISGTSNSSQ